MRELWAAEPGYQAVMAVIADGLPVSQAAEKAHRDSANQRRVCLEDRPRRDPARL